MELLIFCFENHGNLLNLMEFLIFCLEHHGNSWNLIEFLIFWLSQAVAFGNRFVLVLIWFLHVFIIFHYFPLFMSFLKQFCIFPICFITSEALRKTSRAVLDVRDPRRSRSSANRLEPIPGRGPGRPGLPAAPYSVSEAKRK